MTKAMFKKMHEDSRGFTLIELMIVVAIIGILAAVAIPQYQNFVKKSKASEAKVILDGIVTANSAYFAEQNIFATSLAGSLGDPAEGAEYYTYTASCLPAGCTAAVVAIATPNTTGVAAGLVSAWRLTYNKTGAKIDAYPGQGW